MPKTAQKDASVATVKKQGAAMKHIKKYWQWYAMMLIPVGPWENRRFLSSGAGVGVGFKTVEKRDAEH